MVVQYLLVFLHVLSATLEDGWLASKWKGEADQKGFPYPDVEFSGK